MFIIYVVILGIIIGYATRGKLKWLLINPLHYNWLAFVAIGIQVFIFSGLKILVLIPNLIVALLHILSYIVILLFIIINKSVNGIIIIGIGTLLNSIVILLNGGYMPSSSLSTAVHNNVEKLTGATLLPWLGDIFHLPYWLPLTNGFSIGDMCIAVGIFIYLVVNMKQPKQIAKNLV